MIEVVIIGFISTLILGIVMWFKDRYLLSPGVLICAVWSFAYLLQIIRRDINHSSYYYLFFLGAVMSFLIGYLFQTSHRINTNEKITKYTLNTLLHTIIMIMIIILTIYQLLELVSLLNTNFIMNFWQTISFAKREGKLTESVLFEYSRNMIFVYTLLTMSVYFSGDHNKKFKSSIYFLVFSTLIFTFLSNNRGTIFMMMIAITIVYLISTKKNNKKILKYGFILIMLILCIFSITSIMKFVYADQSDTKLFLLSKFKVYFTLSLPAFVQTYGSQHLLYGANTFSFFLKILNQLGFDFEVPANIQSYVYINQDTTNTYTVLDFYTKDFGIIYAFIIMLLLGIIYGKVYRSILINSYTRFKYIVLYSLLIFPLINQMFDDKYFSIFSTWLQFLLWSSLFSKLFIKEYEKIE